MNLFHRNLVTHFQLCISQLWISHNCSLISRNLRLHLRVDHIVCHNWLYLSQLKPNYIVQLWIFHIFYISQNFLSVLQHVLILWLCLTIMTFMSWHICPLLWPHKYNFIYHNCDFISFSYYIWGSCCNFNFVSHNCNYLSQFWLYMSQFSVSHI